MYESFVMVFFFSLSESLRLLSSTDSIPDLISVDDLGILLHKLDYELFTYDVPLCSKKTITSPVYYHLTLQGGCGAG